MDSYNTHIIITQALYFIIHLIILVGCIIIANKSKSAGAILLVIGAALTLVTTVVQTFVNNGLVSFGDVVNIHIVLMYFNLVVYLMFGLGLILFAVDDWKKHN
ncbi:hypothetical protein [Lacinutrix sp.]|uniref:hypothetical protein n=1 Tax=Lacinutrix sp. TaxID=1937692 RepID=UPI0025BB4763|nr:hypothetical protein [Lacinutrix sp.]